MSASGHVPGDAGALIFGALAARVTELAARIEQAEEIAVLAGLAHEIRMLVAGLVADGVGPGAAMRVIAALNDRLAVRVIACVGRTHRLPAASWCWLAFGSEGRSEQTFVTDQDNGIIFSAAGGTEAQALRQLFQPFARAVNEALAVCGFPLCAGEVMAGNPAWCLSLEEWRARFAGWIRTPDPEALLNATIFFDFRPLHGDAGLAEDLRTYLLGLTAANDAFIRMMAGNALTAAPPLGLLGAIAGADSDGGVDLKKQGARLFVDAARIFALAAGLPQVGTALRLRAALQAGTMHDVQAKPAMQAFEYLQQLRLTIQADALAAGRPPGNLVRRENIGEFAYRALQAALQQARLLQRQMKLVFRIEA